MALRGLCGCDGESSGSCGTLSDGAAMGARHTAWLTMTDVKQPAATDLPVCPVCKACIGTGRCLVCKGVGSFSVPAKGVRYESRRPCDKCNCTGECRACYGRGLPPRVMARSTLIRRL